VFSSNNKLVHDGSSFQSAVCVFIKHRSSWRINTFNEITAGSR